MNKVDFRKSCSLEQILPFEICCRIYVFAQNSELKYVSRAFFEISKNFAVCADSILKQLGKKRFFEKAKHLTYKKSELLQNEELVLALLLKGAEVGKQYKSLLLQSVRRRWDSVLQFLLQQFVVSKRGKSPDSTKGTLIQEHRYVVKPQTPINFSREKLLIAALRANNANAVGVLLEAHKTVPSLTLNPSITTCQRHFKIDVSKVTPSSLKIVLEKHNFGVVDLLIYYGLQLREYSDLYVEMSQGEDIEVIEYMVNKGVDIHHGQDAALIKASYKNESHAVVKYLLGLGLDANAHGGEALEIACRNGNLKTAQVLITNGSEYMPPLSEAFYSAIGSKNLDLVTYLVEQGVDVYLKESRAVTTACNILAYEIAEYLVFKGAKVDVEDSYALVGACSHWYQRHYNPRRFSSDNEPRHSNPSSSNDFNSREICSRLAELLTGSKVDGGLRIVRLLLDAGVDVHAGDDEALVEAVRHSRYETVRLLIERGSNVSARNNQAIVEATSFKCYKQYCLQLATFQRADAQHSMRLIESVMCSRYEIVRLLIESGADVNAQGGKALVGAIARSSYEIVDLLVQSGADVRIRDNQALIDSCRQPDSRIVQLLLDHGADVHARDEEALVQAASHSHYEAIRILIEHGANIHARGGQPLVSATEYLRYEVGYMLIKNSVSARAKEGRLLLQGRKLWSHKFD